MIEQKSFGKLADGREAHLFTLTNKLGNYVKVSSFGAVVVSLYMKDRNGNLSDIVLGYDSLEGYVNDTKYQGATVGRYANRIAKGKFILEGKEYNLAINNGENHLHGGIIGFNKVLWDFITTENSDGPSVTFTYVSPDGEESYPGTLTLSVTYTLTEANELKIDYKGETDRTTVLGPTHHSYFNLSGNPDELILDHELMINADSFTPADKNAIPTGEFYKVENTPLDFRKPTKVGLRINDNYEQLLFGNGYDHNWVLNNYNKLVHHAATLYDPKSGRVMEVFTDQPGMQIYTGNYLEGTSGKNGVQYKNRCAICLETQLYPDSPNKPEFPSPVLKPGETYTQTTIYRFTVK